MNKCALDQSSDYSHVELYKYLKNTELPEKVKTAEADDLASLRALPKTAFADELHRAYPMNTPARAFVSHVYFTNKKEALEKEFGIGYTTKIAEKLDVALQLFGLDKEAAAYVKQAEEDAGVDFAEKNLTVKLEDGTDLHLYSIKTSADLEAAAKDLNDNFKTIPMEWRFDLAQDVLKLAKELGVDELPDLLCKYAGMFYPDFEAIKKEIGRRSTKLASDAHKQIFAKLAEDSDNIMSRAEVRKLAEAVYLIEKMEGLYETKTAALLPDVVGMFYSVPVEKIAEMLDVVKMGGETFSLEQLKKVSEDVYEQAFGFKVDFKSADAKDVLETVPRSDVALFKELSGVKGL